MASEISKQTMARNIEAFLQANNMSRRELARRLGVGYSTVATWMIGGSYPRIEQIDKMCTIFGCSKAALVEGLTDAGEPQDPISRIIASLNNEGIQRFVEYGYMLTRMEEYRK